MRYRPPDQEYRQQQGDQGDDPNDQLFAHWESASASHDILMIASDCVADVDESCGVARMLPGAARIVVWNATVGEASAVLIVARGRVGFSR
jgi:hypothetical protein